MVGFRKEFCQVGKMKLKFGATQGQWNVDRRKIFENAIFALRVIRVLPGRTRLHCIQLKLLSFISPFLPVHICCICWCYWTEHKATTQKWLGRRQDLAGLVGEKALRRWETSRLKPFLPWVSFWIFFSLSFRCCHGAFSNYHMLLM